MWLLEAVGSQLYLNQMQTALRVHSLAIEYSIGLWFWSALIALLIGLTMAFLYVPMRKYYGPGPRTAMLTAIAVWIGGYLPYLIGYHMIGLYTQRLLLQWGVVGLAEMMLGSIVSARIYREAPPTAP